MFNRGQEASFMRKMCAVEQIDLTKVVVLAELTNSELPSNFSLANPLPSSCGFKIGMLSAGSTGCAARARVCVCMALPPATHTIAARDPAS